MTESERIYGLFYLALELGFLPVLIPYLNSWLPKALDSGSVNFLFFGINFLMVLLIFHQYLNKSIADFKENTGRIVFTAVLGFFLYWAANILTSWLLLLIFPAFSNANDQTIAKMLQDHFLMMSIGTVILVPPVEEVLHRGLIFGQLRQKNRILAYVVSVLVFAAIHVTGYLKVYDGTTLIACFLQYIPAGIIFAYLYERSGSIFTTILMHSAINALGIFIVR